MLSKNGGLRDQEIAGTAALIAAQAFWSGANARQNQLVLTYRIQLDDLSLETTRSRGTIPTTQR